MPSVALAIQMLLDARSEDGAGRACATSANCPEEKDVEDIAVGLLYARRQAIVRLRQ